jgi:hypothetical protein
MPVMTKQMSALRQRRAELLARIAAQRGRVTEIGTQLQTAFELADRGLAVVRFFRSRPFLLTGIAAVFLARRHGAAALVWSGWRLLTGYRRLSANSAKPSPRG